MTQPTALCVCGHKKSLHVPCTVMTGWWGCVECMNKEGRCEFFHAQPVAPPSPERDAAATKLDEIRARRAASTPGPWKLCHHLQSAESDASCKCGFAGDIWGSDEEHVVCGMGPHCVGANDPGLCPPRYDRPTELANAKFIAHAPEDVDWLLAEVSRLRSDRDRLDLLESRLKEAATRSPDGDEGFWLMYGDERSEYPGFYVDLANRDRPRAPNIRQAIDDSRPAVPQRIETNE